MSDFLNGLKRTDMCGSLRSGDIGRQVTIMGWVVRRRDLGNLIFVQVRDKTGVVQAVFDSSETEKALFDKAFSLRQEYVVAVGGVVRARVYGIDADAQFVEPLLHPPPVLVVGEGDGGIGNERHAAHPVQEAADFGQRVLQIGFSGIGGVGNQEQFHKHLVLIRL